MVKRLFASLGIFVLLFTATTWANEGLVSFKVVESPLEVQVSVTKAKSSHYRFDSSVLNKGSENIYNSQAKLTIYASEGEIIHSVSKKLGVLRAGRIKKFSRRTRIEQPGTYTAEVVVSGFNKSRTKEHVMGARTDFTVQASSSLLSWLLKRLHFWG